MISGTGAEIPAAGGTPSERNTMNTNPTRNIDTPKRPRVNIWQRWLILPVQTGQSKRFGVDLFEIFLNLAELKKHSTGPIMQMLRFDNAGE